MVDLRGMLPVHGPEKLPGLAGMAGLAGFRSLVAILEYLRLPRMILGMDSSCQQSTPRNDRYNLSRHVSFPFDIIQIHALQNGM
jgi:hypothetical protein